MDALGSDLALFGALVLGWRSSPERRRFMGLLLVTLLSTLLIQAVVERPRPFGAPLVILDVPFWSFPSGHASMLGACAVYVAVRDSRWGLGAIMLALVGSALRVIAGMHYASDVGAGLALGGGLGICGAWAGRDERPPWAWLLFPWLGLMVNLQIFATVPLGAVHELFFPGADKPLHFLAFGMLGFFVAAWSRRPERALAVLAVLTALEELSQGPQANRTLDVVDGAMSLAGLFTLGGLGAWLSRSPAQRWFARKRVIVRHER